ncbi:sulfite exporter TauE/SafE family protein [Cupriavidus basilensis]|uniref:Probable membrane transporter protein n=1 Tax=Cupriavidus basilensis TaxID=68895 RepID=A0ABT6AYU7_9BURK|nr:sulfite exporter TauE/SafE family protein [Cupriavidus basilensis]MDF3837801.1 sulfite exporter TauE/SafE family protein [Cupriavidus basilensis]
MDFPVLIVALGAVVAGFVQGLSGFAFGMVAMSFWVWTIEPRLAAAMAVFGSLTGQLVAAVTVRRSFSPRQLLPFLAGGLAGIPIGVAILPSLNAGLFKACLGALLVIWCPLMLLSKQLPQIRAGGRLADGVIGAAGGIMGGIGGFSGVIPTLWCTLRGLPKDEQRAIIQNFNLATLAVTMATYVGSGIVTRAMLPMFMVVGPAMLVPSILGARLYIGISEIAFRRIVLSLLTASGVALLAASLPKLLGPLL